MGSVGGAGGWEKVGEYHRIPGGWLRYGFNRREEFTPDSLVFIRSTGAMYRHCGRSKTVSGWEETVQSMESGKYRTMTIGELEAFKKG